MTMTLDLAHKILEAFGPGSATVESVSATNMVERFNDKVAQSTGGKYSNPETALMQFVEFEMHSERQWWTRCIPGYKNKTPKQIEEATIYLNEMEKRVMAVVEEAMTPTLPGPSA